MGEIRESEISNDGRANRSGRFGPKGQDNLAQGLPWVNFPHRIGPEGAVRCGEDCLLIATVAFPPVQG